MSATATAQALAKQYAEQHQAHTRLRAAQTPEPDSVAANNPVAKILLTEELSPEQKVSELARFLEIQTMGTGESL